MFFVAIIIVLAVILMAIILFMTDLLLDPSPVAAVKSFSLSRTQFAFWILIVFCSWVCVWGSRGYLLNGSASPGSTSFFLLGISCSVTVAARAIDRAEIRNKIQGRITGRHQDQGSEGFFRDILSDKKGFSIYRIQHVMLTLALMAVFAAYALSNNTMPVFNDVIVVLFAISSAGYIAMKINENK